MNRTKFAFSKINFIICGIAFAVIVIGFLLMLGPVTTFPAEAAPGSENGFQPDIFSFRRRTLAPMLCFFGFLFMVAGILFPASRKGDTEGEEETIEPLIAPISGKPQGNIVSKAKASNTKTLR